MSMKVARNLFGKDKNILIEFYEANKDNVMDYKKKDAKNLLICNYNVHGWVNINEGVTVNDNFNNILTMISQCKDIDIIVFEEVCFRDHLTQTYIEEKFKEIGFIDSLTVPNGGCFLKKGSCDYIMIFGKKLFGLKESIDISTFIRKRCCAVVQYEGIKIVALHLEIGKRFHHLPKNEYRANIEEENANMRKQGLDKILGLCNNVDIIMGDFNFSYDDPEFNWLLGKGFRYCNDLTHTTPYNRTDMVFLSDKNKKMKNVSNLTIKSNYSDHLPILCEILYK